jgi:phage terminase small subunit
MKPLSAKHKLFVEYYLGNGYNATKAYLSAYPKVTELVAAASASRLLLNVNIKSAIDKKVEKTITKLELSRESLIQDLQEIKEEQKTKNSHASIKAIEVISKLLGLYETKVDITSKGEKISINLDLGEKD